MYKGYKRKKGVVIQIDDKKGHLFLSSDESPRLLMLRPIDLIEFAEFAGANAEDILIWVGKTLGKYFLEKSELEGTDLSTKSMHEKKGILTELVEILIQLGYGFITLMCKKNSIYFMVKDPLSENERENIMAKNLCILYEGIFSGILDFLEIDADGQEIECYLLGGQECIFQFDMLMDEFNDEDVDQERPVEGGVSEFLSSF